MCAHLPQGIQVHINGTGTQLTAAGIGQVAAAGTPQHSAQKNDGRAHLLHQRLRNGIRAQISDLHRHRVFLYHTAAAQMGQNSAGGKYIRQPGAIFQSRLAVTEQRPRQNRQGAVFRPVQKDLTLQRYAAFDHQFLQSASPLFISVYAVSAKLVKPGLFCLLIQRRDHVPNALIRVGDLQRLGVLPHLRETAAVLVAFRSPG